MDGRKVKATMSRQNGNESGTLASTCYQRLRAEIRKGRFKPGEPLRIAALTEEFKIGHSPIREALNRLAADGFIIQSDQRGFRIPPASVDELLELTRTRCAIAEITLTESLRTGGKDWEERVVIAHYRISRKRYGEGENYEEYHAEFHRSLSSACRSPWLLDFSDKLYELAARYRSLALSADIDTRVLDQAGKDHDDLFEAAIRRDIRETIKIHNMHVQRASEEILANRSLFDEGLIQGDWREREASAASAG